MASSDRGRGSRTREDPQAAYRLCLPAVLPHPYPDSRGKCRPTPPLSGAPYDRAEDRGPAGKGRAFAPGRSPARRVTGGEMQRAAIAQCPAVNNPRILLAHDLPATSTRSPLTGLPLFDQPAHAGHHSHRRHPQPGTGTAGRSGTTIRDGCVVRASTVLISFH